MALKLFSRRRTETPPPPAPPEPRHYGAPPPYEPADPVELNPDPLLRCVQLGRYGIVTARRDQWRNHAGAQAILDAAIRAIDEQFALVPEGFISLPHTISGDPGGLEADVETQAFLLQRTAVTNAQYQNF